MMTTWIGKISLLFLLVVDASFDKSLKVGVGNDEVYCLNEGTMKDGKLSCNDNKFVLVHTTYEIRTIPDIDTLEALVRQKVDATNVSWIPSATPGLLEHPGTVMGPPLQSLRKNANDPDEFMRVTIWKCVYLNPVDRFMTDGPHFVPGLLNGAILRVPKFSNRTYYSVWLGGWPNGEGLRFGAVNKGNYTVRVYGAETRIPDLFNGRLYNQQEGRPLLLPDGESIFVVYCARFYGNPLPPFTQMYGIIRRNATTNQFHMDGFPVWIDYIRNDHTKNFVPFLYEKQVHLIPSFHPLVILRVEKPTDDGLGPVTIVYHQHREKDASGLYSVAMAAPPGYNLPWKEEYGTHIRGGTPAIPVPGKDFYLLFFHTRQHGPAWGVDHYFMGAMTLCPHPPFSIRTMSQIPIVPDPLWYEGPWNNKVSSYVIYPIGIVIEPSDPDHVTVSIGHQDKNMFIVTFHIDSLLKTLDHVNDCSPVDNTDSSPPTSPPTATTR